jgi:hypothetical protein
MVDGEVSMHDSNLLAALETWFAEHVDDMAARGVQMSLSHSPADHPKASMSLDMDSENSVGQIVVWDSGEAEIQYGDVATGQVEHVHRDLASREDLMDALGLLTARIGPGRTP